MTNIAAHWRMQVIHSSQYSVESAMEAHGNILISNELINYTEIEIILCK